MTLERAPGLIVAAPASGGGKTTVTLGLLAALRRQGLAVASAKVGPDYIDPSLHRAATGREALNLDGWAMAPRLLDSLMARASENADVLICEGVMGLFDGAAGPGFTNCGSTAEIAARSGWPVVLVVDMRGQSQSVAALVHGFKTFRADVTLAGVILNRIGSDRHRQMATEALGDIGVPVFGAVPRSEALALPERHLGLVQAEDSPELDARLAAFADMISEHVALDALLAAARPTEVASKGGEGACLPPLGQRIAVAHDAAFTFRYGHLLDGWRRGGAEIVFFSPLADEAPPRDADAVYLPGGYPELHAERIASDTTFLDGLRRFARTRPVYGECGGHIVLGRSLEVTPGRHMEMAGLLGHSTSFAQRHLYLGYRRAVLSSDCALGRAGRVLTGHEFHYVATSDAGTDPPLFHCHAADGRDLGAMGSRRGHVLGSFFHVISGAPA